jgi:signal transduction histidine kinase
MSIATKSIAFRLIVAVLAVELLSSVLVVFLSFGYERHAHFTSFDVMLRGHADSMLVAVQDSEDPEDNVILNQADLHLPPDDIYEVVGRGGKLLGRSSNWRGAPPNAWADPSDGFLKLEVDHRNYRVLRLHGSRFIDANEPGGGKLRPVIIFYGIPTDRVWHAIWGTVEFYAAGSLVLLLVTGPLIAWLLHRGLEPLRQLASLASRVSADSWEFSPPASARETSELSPMTHAIESVLQRLERSFVQQRTFVSDAAHELKTAVAVVKSSLQLLGIRERSREEYQAGVDRSLADTQRLEELVVKMLTLARVESGRSEINADTIHQPLACDLAECVRQTVAQMETFAIVHGVRVDSSGLPTGPCVVPLAADDCALLVSNLMLNALQHSPQGSQVEIRIREQDSNAELQVKDQGEGIDPVAVPHIFDRFYRGDPSRTRSTGGAGLGLAICKAVVEKAGGAIVLNTAPGSGTEAIVRLAKAPTANPAVLQNAV